MWVAWIRIDRPSGSMPRSAPLTGARADRTTDPDHGRREPPLQEISRRETVTPRISNRAAHVSDTLDRSDWITGRSVAAQRSRIRPPAALKTRGTQPAPPCLRRSDSVPPKVHEGMRATFLARACRDAEALETINSASRSLDDSSDLPGRRGGAASPQADPQPGHHRPSGECCERTDMPIERASFFRVRTVRRAVAGRGPFV